MSAGKTPVFLLKTRSTPADGYEEYFSSPENGDYLPIFVPVLEHRFNEKSLLHLSTLIKDDIVSKDYSGIIFTSQRAVEAFSKVVTDLRDDGVDVDILLTSNTSLFVVGPATARGLNALATKCPILGEDSGNGDALASFILDKHMAEAAPKAMLFLVGEQRRDIIPKRLQSEQLPLEKRIRVDELTVYETGVMESFPADFESKVHAPSLENRVKWIVVFSPTGCRAMLQAIGIIDSTTGKLTTMSEEKRNHLIATIGPTTRDHLIREFKFHPEVWSPKPSPDGVGSAIKEYMHSLGNS